MTLDIRKWDRIHFAETAVGRLQHFRLLKITPCDRLLCDAKQLLIKHNFQQRQ
jgi:hypothetical protein